MKTATVPVDYEGVKGLVAHALALIDPTKPYGTELFEALCRVTVSVCVEAVCLRRNPDNGVLEVLLSKRPEDDTAYPGEWHTPGSYKRPGESDEDVFTRLATKEFQTPILRKRFIAPYDNPREVRGHLVHLVYLCDVDKSTKGTWYPVNSLPERTVDFHRDQVIPMTVQVFGS